MIKIAVVDDDELICKEIVRLISKFNVCYDFDFRPEYYCSCEEVYNSIVSGCNYDLIFLDIEFSGMNGTEAIPHKDCATDASSNFSSDETKSGVNTGCIHEHFCEI